MSKATHILDLLIKIQESADMFPRECDGIFDGINLLEVHCIDRIGTIEYANVTKIANEMKITRGGISKICKRMLGNGLIESYQRSDNHKEIYYRLTENGRRVYNQHKKIHDKARQEKLFLLNTFNESEQASIFRFLSGIIQLHNKKMAEGNSDQD